MSASGYVPTKGDKTMNTSNTTGAEPRSLPVGHRKIDRAKFVEALTSLRNNPQLPAEHISGIDKWLANGAHRIHSVSEDELEKLLVSIRPIDAKIKANDPPPYNTKPLADINPHPTAINAREDHSATPAATVSNAQFTRAIFGQLPDGHLIAATNFSNYESQNWQASFGRPENLPDRPESNSYFSPSSLTGKGRDLDHFAALHVLVLDDITPGVLAKLPEPTYAIETSSDNFQVGYMLYVPLTDKSRAQSIHQALTKSGYCDSNGNNPVRWVRLPVGMNTKPDKMFAHKLKIWEPERQFELMALADSLELKLEVENPTPTATQDPFANMPEPKLQVPGALAGLLNKLDPDHSRDDWRKAISCVFVHLGEDGYVVARDWSSTGKKYMLTPTHRKITSLESAEAQFRKVWNEIAADTSFRMGPGAFFDILQAQYTETSGLHGMTKDEIAAWKKSANQAESEQKITPPPEFSLAGHFANHTLTTKDAEKMERTKFIFPNLIPQGLITAYPSPPNGGKTAIFTHAACKLADQGFEVFYINADASPSQLKSQQEKADEHGFKILAPDAKDAGGVNGLMGKLTELSQTDINLSKFVLIIDTLKKFVDMLSKNELKNFINLLRKLVAKGATVCLLVHTNKYLATDGKLIYEGTADLRADIDNMIYLYSSLVESGLREVTSAPDKTRTTFSPISFRIRFGEWGVTVEELDVVLPCFTDELREVFNAATQAIKNGIRLQEALVQHVAEELMLGVNKAREKIKEVCNLNNSPLIRRRVQNAPGFTFSILGENPVPHGEF